MQRSSFARQGKWNNVKANEHIAQVQQANEHYTALKNKIAKEICEITHYARQNRFDKWRVKI